ncbi:MAG TPA: hypothetical protein VF414_19925 [Thermoanaerobaculia bacterium]
MGTTTNLTGVLQEDALYLGDNGRCFCGRLDHAGMTAYFTGRDLSGHCVHAVTEADQREARRLGVVLACETCSALTRQGR